MGELRSIIVNLGESMTPQLADCMVKDADIYSEGLVDIEGNVLSLYSNNNTHVYIV